MKKFGIASPRFVINTLPGLFLFVFLETVMLLFGLKSSIWYIYLIPFLFLVLFSIDVVIYRNAYFPYWMNTNGIRNHRIQILWQDITNVELIHTEISSRFIRGRKIQRFSICIGNAVHGDLFSQSSTNCILLPQSRRNIAYLRQLGGGKNAVLHAFIKSQEETI